MSQSANLIGSAEVARLLGWSLAKVKRAALAGHLPTYSRLPGKTGAYLFDRDDVVAWSEQAGAA